MNRKITVIVALFAMVFGISTTSVFGEVLEPPTVGGMTSGAVIPEPAVVGPRGSTPETKYETGRQVELAGQNAPKVDIRVVPVLLPAQQDPDFWPVARVLVANRLADVSDVAGWSLCRGKIVAANLAAGPTNNWWALEQMIELMSVDGEDTVDLAGIQVKATSYPSPALNSVYGVGDRGYGSAAIGVRKDGTLVVSGPPTQKVSRVIFITQMALFTDNLSAVESWVNGQGNFTIRYEARYRDSTYIGKGVVSIGGYTTIRPIFSMVDGIKVEGGDSHRPYLFQASEIVNDQYQTISRRPVFQGDTMSRDELIGGRDVTHPQEFFRLVGADW